MIDYLVQDGARYRTMSMSQASDQREVYGASGSVPMYQGASDDS